ncbi:hypothetical protein KY348_03445 [Candidatus Woesearchaeota archaeon]|nr:hypothetical protein [Candidatus Woesearchaeota archaeon]
MKIRTSTKIFVILIFLSLALNLSLAKEEQELRSELLKLNNVKEEMTNSDTDVSRVDDLITEGFLYFNNKDYNKTKEVISSIYKLRNDALNAQSELSVVNQLYLDVKERNITLVNATSIKIEWDLDYAKREFDKENYEGALKRLAKIKKALLYSINNEYNYLNASLLALEEKINSLKLSKSRITTLKSLLSEALGTGGLRELEIIKQEAGVLNKSLVYYKEIKLAIPILKGKNLSAQRINDGLNAAKLDLDFADYESAFNKLESLKALTEKGIFLEDEISELEKNLADEKAKQRIDITEAESFLKEAQYELTVGNYETAEQKLLNARDSYESLKAELLIKKAGLKSFGFSLKEFIKRNWPYVLLIIFIILVVLKFTSHIWVLGIQRKRLARLKKELNINENMVQELQRNYFVHKKMSRENYDKSYESLQEKTVNLKEKISLFNKKVKKGE